MRYQVRVIYESLPVTELISLVQTINQKPTWNARPRSLMITSVSWVVQVRNEPPPAAPATSREFVVLLEVEVFAGDPELYYATDWSQFGHCLLEQVT